MTEYRFAFNPLTNNFDLLYPKEIGLKSILFDTTFTPATLPEGLAWWNATDKTINVSTGTGPIAQLAQELYVIAYNDTGAQIDNGSTVYISGSFGTRPTIALANAKDHTGISGQVLVATEDIADAAEGFVTAIGKVRKVDTSMFSLGDVLWVSGDVDGGLTNVRPQFPDYAVRAARVTVSDAENGELITGVSGVPEDTVINFWNAVFRETMNFTVTSDGVTITGNLQPDNGHDDMTMMFSDGFTLLDTTPPKTITLTPGTDAVPQANFIYIPESTKVLTVSTSDWPSGEHIKVATTYLRTAGTTQTEGALKNHNWNDHIESTINFSGHLQHITERMRQDNAKWHSGVEGSVTIDSVPTPDDVFVSNTGGVVYQLHRQDFPALDMETGNDMHIVNDSIAPYKTVTNLNGEILDATGTSLANKSFSFVVWGVINRAGQQSHLMLNLPIGSYQKNQPGDAVSDADNFSVYDIPSDFSGTGFLIARFTFTLDAGGNVWTLEDTQDLRGKQPNTSVGGGGPGGGGVSSWLALTDTPSAFLGQAGKIPMVGLAETAIEFTDEFITTVPALSTRNVIQPTGPTIIPFTLKGAVSQSANLQEWQDSSGAVLASVDSSGTIILPTAAVDTEISSTEIKIGQSSGSGWGTIRSDDSIGMSLGWKANTRVAFASTSMIPSVTNGLSLGTSSFRWNGLYSDGLGWARLQAHNSGNTVFVAKGAVAQSANLQEWQDSSATVLGGVSFDGVPFAHRGQIDTNSFFGKFSGENVDSSAGGNSGSSNSFFGKFSGQDTTTGFRNTFLGYAAGANNTEASNNTAIGAHAFDAANTGSSNVAIGAFALTSNTSGTQNMSIGANSMVFNTTGKNNMAIGFNALWANVFSDGNCAVGTNALFRTVGHSNTGIGSEAGKDVTGFKNIFIGFNAAKSQTSINDELWIHNSNVSAPLIHGLFTASGGLTINSVGATGIPFTVKGAVSQSANLQEWQDSAGTVLSSVQSDGSETILGLHNLGFTSSTADPTTTELPTDKDTSIHKNTTSGNVFLSYNDGGTIKKVQLT